LSIGFDYVCVYIHIYMYVSTNTNVVVVTVVVVVVDNLLQRLWATHIYFAACAFKANKKNNTKKIGDNPRNDSNNSKKHTYPIDTERERKI